MSISAVCCTSKIGVLGNNFHVSKKMFHFYNLFSEISVSNQDFLEIPNWAFKKEFQSYTGKIFSIRCIGKNIDDMWYRWILVFVWVFRERVWIHKSEEALQSHQLYLISAVPRRLIGNIPNFSFFIFYDLFSRILISNIVN